jgi:hypothetical protein
VRRPADAAPPGEIGTVDDPTLEPLADDE